MNKQKLWIVSELFYPVDTSTSYIMTRIAEFMHADFEVEVLTGPSQYDSVKHDKIEDNFPFKVNRIETGNFNKNGLLSRTLRLIWISISFCWFIFRKVKPGDKIFMVTNPAFLIVAMPLLKKRRKFELDILVHDVFPENLVAAGVLKNQQFPYGLLKKIFDWAYGKADKLITLGIDMKYKLLQKTPASDSSIHIVQNWADINAINIEPFESNPIIKEQGLEHKIVLTFAGNIGRVQGVDSLINLIEEIKNEHLHFLFIGDGAMTARVIELSEKTSRVTYLGRLPRAKQNEFLNASHIGIVSVNDKMEGLGVPSKSYNILAAGKPILFLGNKNTEIAEMTQANKLGWVFEHAEKRAILNFLNSMRRDNLLIQEAAAHRIRDFVCENFSEQKVLERLKQAIEA